MSVALTVALPMFRAGKIAWLALEGLCRQRDVDFEWEVLVAEEPTEAFGPERLGEYRSRLKVAGCAEMRYEAVPERLPLSEKWALLGRLASPTSRCFLLQGADDYSEPRRLRTTMDVFRTRELDWLCYRRGLFYDIPTGVTGTYLAEVQNERKGISIAIRMELVRDLVGSGTSVAVDTWLFHAISQALGGNVRVVRIEGDAWQDGLYTHGQNQISQHRAAMVASSTPPFQRADLAPSLPPALLQRLRLLGENSPAQSCDWLHLEITTRCTARCAMCPRDTLERKDRDMPRGQIMDLVRQAWEMGIKEIHPHLFGEPTMHPEYCAILDSLGHDFPGMEVVQYTNGFGLADPAIRTALLRNAARVVISVDGATPAQMQAARPGLAPERIAAGVEALYAERRGKRPQIIMRCTINGQDETQIAAYRERWAPHCDRPSFPPLQGFHGFLPSVAPVRDGRPCNRIFGSLLVDVLGRALLCCDDYAAEVVVGDATVTPLAEIWKGDALAKIRALHLAGEYDQVPICAKCSWHGTLKGWNQ